MDVSENNFRSLLEGGKQYIVPLFQRPYSWGKKNWDALWDDIMSLYDEEELEGSHFLGAIVTQSVPSTTDGISPYLLIDGQQRIVTLTLLLAALRDHLRKNKQTSDQGDELHGLYLTNLYKKGEAQYKVLSSKADRKMYQQVISNEEVKEKGTIYDVYDFFLKKIRKYNELDKLRNVVLEYLAFVIITVDDKDDPYLIFESLNYKGQQLTQADLVGNYFFMRLPSDQHEKTYNELWLPLQQSFKDKAQDNYSYLEELTKAFWYYLRKDGCDIKQNQVYQRFKQRLEKPESDIQAALEDLIKFAQYYQHIRFPEEEPEIRLSRWFKRFMRLQFTSAYPFLLNLYHEYAEQKFSVDEFELILRYVESYFVRRLFAKEPTRSLNKVFNNLYTSLKKQRAGNIVDNLKEVLTSKERTQIWPDDDQFRQDLVKYPLYTSNTYIDRVKLILESIEERLTDTQNISDNVRVEHIMPQNLTDEWEIKLGTKAEEEHKLWVHTLGNLTLTSESSEVSNKSCDERLALLQNSDLALNYYYFGESKVDSWNVEEIKLRANWLADIAIQVWPR
jgi:uncharacterized protein with ParB-like and HNH nuclease domain